MKNRSLPLCLSLLVTGCAPEGVDQDIESSSSAITAGAVYSLKLSKMSGDTGNCVDVTGKSLVNGGNIEEWSCNGGVAQEFIPTWPDKVAALRHAARVCDVCNCHRHRPQRHATNLFPFVPYQLTLPT